MTHRQSTLPNNTPLRLPPLSPPLQSHPQAFNNPSLPVVYSLQLPQEVVKTLLSAHSNTSIRFNTNESGEIRIPNANPIPFSVRPIADANASTARATCYSRRDNSLRTIGPIIADLDVERTLSKSVAATTKKRTLEARNAGRARDLKVVDDIPATHPAKKPRKKPTEKRPRAQRRTPSAPVPPHINGVRISRPTPTSAPASAPLSAPAPSFSPPPAPLTSSSPTFGSPAVSPGHSNSKTNGSSRSTPTRNAFSAMQSHKVSPGSVVNLPKPVSRPTPTKSNRFSPVGSRGPSPSVHSPGSPRVAGIRPPRTGDQTELRRQTVHFLALGEYDMKAIKERLDSGRIEYTTWALKGVLADIAEAKGAKFVLRKKNWADVTEKFEYTSAERAKMRAYRAEVDDSGRDRLKIRNMSDEKLDAAVDSFWREYKDTEERITCEKDESELRKRFTDLYPLYIEMIKKMEDLQSMFKALETRFLGAKNKEEKEDLARSITIRHKEYEGRHTKFERVLPLLHTRMKRIRRALDDYVSCEEER